MFVCDRKQRFGSDTLFGLRPSENLHAMADAGAETTPGTVDMKAGLSFEE